MYLDDSLKLNLFSKNHQAMRLVEEFEKIRLLPKRKRQAWIIENEEMLLEQMNSFANDSMVMLDGLDIEDEVSNELSIEFVTNLRNAMNTIRGVLIENGRLSS